MKFINNLPFYGYSIVCIDNLNLKRLSQNINSRNIITYSINQKSDIKISAIIKNKNKTEFTLYFKKGFIKNISGKYNFTTTLLGDHNVLNSTAAITAALIANVPIKNIYNSLSSFQGVKRRFSFLGKINKASIYDDYAHHPSEIKASYEIAKQISKKNIVVVFQPHRFSRTSMLLNDFIKILKKIKILYVLDIYSAGEQPIKNINSKNLVDRLQSNNSKTYYLSKEKKLDLILKPYFNDDNAIIFMGAGSVTFMAQNLFKK